MVNLTLDPAEIAAAVQRPIGPERTSHLEKSSSISARERCDSKKPGARPESMQRALVTAATFEIPQHKPALFDGERQPKARAA